MQPDKIDRRSLSESISREQLKKYEQLSKKNLRREKSVLSHSRYNKMRKIIMKEV